MLLRGDTPALSLIVPVYEERGLICELMATLEPFLGLHELVIVDGGSSDGTYESLLQRGVGRVIRSPKGRAAQMNAGAKVARGHVLMFLHADTSIDHEGPEMALQRIDRGADAGCFKVKIHSRHRRLRVAGHLQSARSKMITSATGDQALFVRRSVFHQLGGFDEGMPICEDLDLVRRLSSRCGGRRFVCVDHYVTTSGRRWEKSGISKTIALMWGLRAAYHLGVDARELARFYQTVR